MDSNKEILEIQFKQYLREHYKRIGKMGGIAKNQKYSRSEVSEMALKGLEKKSKKGDNSKKKAK